MTKKPSLPFFIAVYLISLAAGFGFYGIQKANATPPVSTTERQSAWILVRVDDLTTVQPKLVSVWAMFLTYSPGPQVFFKPLFSIEASTNRYPELGNVFKVSADRTISPAFMKELNRLIPHQSGLVFLDDLGSETFMSWFARPSTNDEAQALVPRPGSAHTSGGETGKYYQICATLEQAARPNLASLTWRDLLPNHMTAYPSLKKLTDLWGKLILSSYDTHCEVIAEP